MRNEFILLWNERWSGNRLLLVAGRRGVAYMLSEENVPSRWPLVSWCDESRWILESTIVQLRRETTWLRSSTNGLCLFDDDAPDVTDFDGVITLPLQDLMWSRGTVRSLIRTLFTLMQLRRKAQCGCGFWVKETDLLLTFFVNKVRATICYVHWLVDINKWWEGTEPPTNVASWCLCLTENPDFPLDISAFCVRPLHAFSVILKTA